MSNTSTTALLNEQIPPTVSTIYPTGFGDFALGSPDGQVLQDNQVVETLLGGYWIVGVIACAHHEYPHFIALVDKSVCGLYAGMQIRPLSQFSGEVQA